jgi:hypothetical protein
MKVIKLNLLESCDLSSAIIIVNSVNRMKRSNSHTHALTHVFGFSYSLE